MRGVLLDLDGVVYVGDEPVPGAAATIDWLAREGVPYCFLTNTTSRARQAIVDKLAGPGIAAGTSTDWLRSASSVIARETWADHAGEGSYCAPA